MPERGLESRNFTSYLPEWQVVFLGSPNWAVNLPFFLKCGSVVVVATFAAFAALSVASPVPLVAAVVVLTAASGVAVLRVATTAYTEIMIDSVRLTYRTGILTRRVASVELYRVQNVECVSAWWERLLGFGTLVVESSDVNHPRWILCGMNNVEFLREWMNQAAIERRDVKGIREVNMGRV